MKKFIQTSSKVTILATLCATFLFFPISSKADSYAIQSLSHSSKLVHVHGHRPGLGRFRAKLNFSQEVIIPVTIKGSTKQSTHEMIFTLLRGQVQAPRFYRKRSAPIEGVLYSSGSVENLFIPVERDRGLRRSFNISTGNKITRALNISRAKPIQTFRCSAETILQPPLPLFRTRSTGGQTLVLGVDIDSRFYKLHKNKTLLAAVLALQKASQVYAATFGYTLRVGSITQYTSTSTDPVGARYASSTELLLAYQQYRQAQPISGADIHHLMTAQRGYLDAIGLAHIGTTCALPQFAVSWSDYASGFFFFAQTLIHELGHNLSATHDPTDPRSLMAVSNTVNIINPYFSTYSTSEINSFVGTYGSCLADSTGTEIPTPSASSYRHPNEKASSVLFTSSLNKCGSRKCITGKVTTRTGTPISGRVIELLSFPPATLLKTTTTNRNGEYKFKLTTRGGFYVSDRMSQRTSRLFTAR